MFGNFLGWHWLRFLVTKASSFSDDLLSVIGCCPSFWAYSVRLLHQFSDQASTPISFVILTYWKRQRYIAGKTYRCSSYNCEQSTNSQDLRHFILLISVEIDQCGMLN